MFPWCKNTLIPVFINSQKNCSCFFQFPYLLIKKVLVVQLYCHIIMF
ncbi:hypothetical protein SLEP1_g12038 [Rubroshorea leprosula]|nr:hypothetical protein SLEP1_g12038 [Rubroshorea leprosula]